MRFSSLGVPILFVGDNPSLPGGLSRICRDLSTLCATLSEFRVGVLGRGLGNRRRFPFTLYDFNEGENWGEGLIGPVWNDFRDGSDGIIMTLDDPSRRGWFSNPQMYPGPLVQFLGPGRTFSKWGYFPIDSVGPVVPGSQGTLGIEGRMTVGGYDRVLAPSEWGRNILRNSGRMDADWIPHGIHVDKFHPVENARGILGWESQDIWVGSVMANQARKDFPVLMDAIRILRGIYGNKLKAWVHTDTLVRYWNIPALAQDYGVLDILEISMDIPDEQLAVRYSGCDCTILPSGGEGFSYTTAESLACGTGQVVADYAAAQELVPAELRVRISGLRVDSSHNVQRAVLSGGGFARKAREEIERSREDPEFRSGQLAQSVEHLGWDKLRFTWGRWLKEGLR